MNSSVYAINNIKNNNLNLNLLNLKRCDKSIRIKQNPLFNLSIKKNITKPQNTIKMHNLFESRTPISFNSSNVEQLKKIAERQRQLHNSYLMRQLDLCKLKQMEKQRKQIEKRRQLNLKKLQEEKREKIRKLLNNLFTDDKIDELNNIIEKQKYEKEQKSLPNIILQIKTEFYNRCMNEDWLNGVKDISFYDKNEQDETNNSDV